MRAIPLLLWFLAACVDAPEERDAELDANINELCPPGCDERGYFCLACGDGQRFCHGGCHLCSAGGDEVERCGFFLDYLHESSLRGQELTCRMVGDRFVLSTPRPCTAGGLVIPSDSGM